MDKENAIPENVVIKTPPALVPVGKRKSSVKRVRFSLATSSPSSPIRLSQSDAQRRSSTVSSNSSSPLHFPSQQELLMTAVPQPSPDKDSRQSFTGILNHALNSFDVPSIWDTPSSEKQIASSGVLNLSKLSPVRRSGSVQTPSRSSILESAATPGAAERKFLGFSVLEAADSACSRQSLPSPDPEGDLVRIDPRTKSPSRRSKVSQEDDPLLMSGASSVLVPAGLGDSSTRRRRRRLSSLEEIESELMNVSSPERSGSTDDSSARKLLANEGIFIERLLAAARPDISTLLNNDRSSSPELQPVAAEWESLRLENKASSTCPFALIVSCQQVKSAELSIDSAIRWTSELIDKSRSSLCGFSVDLLKNEIDPSQIASEKLKAEIVKKTVLLRLWENQETNLGQTTCAIRNFGEQLEELEEELEKLDQDCAECLGHVEKIKAEIEPEFKSVFLENGQRRKSEQEIRFDKLQEFVSGKESEIRSVIGQISQLEGVISEKERAFSQGFAKLKAFFDSNGWNVIKEINNSMTVLVYCVCHILVFQKAHNDKRYWRLDKIVPVKWDSGKSPSYARNFESNQVRFNSQLVLEHIIASNGLRTPFRYDPSILHALMGAATAILIEWVKLRDMLGELLTKSDSRIKINSNMQIEAVVVAPNTQLGIEVPLTVKLLWFDPLFANEPVKYNNFSYILTESVVTVFPSVREQLDSRFASLQGDSFQLISDIFKTVQSVLVNAKPALSVIHSI